MRFKWSVLSLVIALSTLASAWADGQYELKYSDLLRNCSFIHRDEFSLESFQELVKSQLESRVAGDNACHAAYSALNSNLSNMLTLVNTQVSAQDARKLYGEVYGNYMVSLQTELALLNPSDPRESARASSLQSQIDVMRTNLLEKNYEVQLYNGGSKSVRMEQGQQQLYQNISAVVQGLAQMPPGCVDKVGGWRQVLPVVLNAASFVGVASGQWFLPAASAGVQVGVDLAQMLIQSGPKNAIREVVSSRNDQILACTYQALTHQACELRRAAKSVGDSAQVQAIIQNRFRPGPEGEYERFQRTQQVLVRVKSIMAKVGAMGSAVTLDLNLLASYFTAVRIRPHEIVIPPSNSSPEVINRWLNDIYNRGIMISSTDMIGRPVTLEERYQDAVTKIADYKLTIATVIETIREKRSFKDLRDELVLESRNLVPELKFLQKFLKSFPLEKSDIPSQYVALFTATDRMLEKIIDFVNVVQNDGETYEAYLERVNVLGEIMFAEFSYGSVAQVTAQTVLMIPEIAFERFGRPFRAAEQYYLNRDLERQDDTTYDSYATYMINRSMQVRVLGLYSSLSASGQAFRLEPFEATKKAFETGFSKEIRHMLEGALGTDSRILSSTHAGKTAAHLCALFADHLRRNEPQLYKRCRQSQRSLPLYEILRGFHRPASMVINYQDPCFYNAYKREEYMQELLFERLLDRGVGQSPRSPSTLLR